MFRIGPVSRLSAPGVFCATRGALLVALASWSSAGVAGLDSLAGLYANDVEEAAARANQATYDALLVQNGGPCRAQQSAAAGDCTGGVFDVFNSTREFVQTANEISGSGPIEYSLGLDLGSLGEALRWSAGEEFAGQGTLTSDFIDGQLSGLVSRVTALRFGATGFFVAGMPTGDGQQIAATTPHQRAYGGGASADDDTYLRWGGFINGSYGYGDKDGTGNENAFDFDGYQVSAGLDYRVNDNWVVGGVFGYNEQEIDFQQVANLVVDGGIDSDGYSIQPFVLFQGERFFASGALGYQSLSFDSDRFIKYPSLNPDVDNTNTRTRSDTDSEAWTAHLTLGYGFDIGSFYLEPYATADYADISVDGFTENDLFNAGFDFEVDEQEFESIEAALGTKFVYTFLPSWGVISPFVDVEWRNQFEDDPRTVKAVYRQVSDVVDAAAVSFRVQTEELDDQYFLFAVGASVAIPGGLQAFLSYRFLEDLENYSHEVFSGGIRYAF